jgi:integrase/recombinase XerD
MQLSEMNAKRYADYVLYLKSKLGSDTSVQTYGRDLRTVLYFLMREGHVESFKVKEIKTDRHAIDTYTDEELIILLKKPNMKKCRFLEYQAWVMTNFLFTTGVRQRSLIHLQIKDFDAYNGVISVRVTKNRKPLIIPLNKDMVEILKEYLRYRQCEDKEAYLFCNAYGDQLRKGTHYAMMAAYNKARGVETTGIHRYRHTFAKQWILNGGSVVSLSKILGHSNLNITQNYLNLLVTDLAKQVDEVNLLDKFAAKKHLTMR